MQQYWSLQALVCGGVSARWDATLAWATRNASISISGDLRFVGRVIGADSVGSAFSMISAW